MQNKNKKGFTLLEVLVVITMVAIMTVATLSTLNTNRIERELEAAGDQVYSALRETQNYALTGKEVDSGCDMYEFHYDGENYRIENTSSTGDTCTFSFGSELKNAVQFSGADNISFSVPHGNVGIAGVKSIGLEKDGRTYNVCVYDTGVITRTRTTCSNTPE